MMKFRIFVLILCILIMVGFVVFNATFCLAQFWSPYSLINPFATIFSGYSPFNTFLPVMSPVIPLAEPLLTPYSAGLPTLGRFANATVIIILNQTTNPVTAYAPLGTVTLTPSAFLPLGLFLTLAE